MSAALKQNDIFTYGCESNILQLLKLPDGTVKVLGEGIKRVKLLDFKDLGEGRENFFLFSDAPGYLG